MKFVQFLRPDGRQRDVFVDRSEEIERKAAELVAGGCRFEIEELRTGKINMDCTLNGEVLGGGLCDNGPSVLETVDRLVTKSYDAFKKV